MNVQDVFLNQVRKEKVPVTIEALSGALYSGTVKGFDNFCVFLQTADGPCLLYKHALSKITTPKDFSLKPPAEREFTRRP